MTIESDSWFHNILDELGCICGEVSGRRYETEADAKSKNYGIAAIARTIPAPGFPLVVLDDIQVDKGRQGIGIGTRALRSLIVSARAADAAAIMLRLGFESSTEEGWSRAIRLDVWYRREGFLPFLQDGLVKAKLDPDWAIKNPTWCWYWRAC